MSDNQNNPNNWPVQNGSSGSEYSGGGAGIGDSCIWRVVRVVIVAAIVIAVKLAIRGAFR